jgi:molybdenum cofactor biosynthesis protein B
MAKGSKSVDEHRAAAADERPGFALVTVSDTRSEDDDRTGRRMRELVEDAGFEVVDQLIVPDDTAPLRSAVSALLAHHGVDVIVVAGGTGVSPRDVSIEALEPFFDRPLPGFGELFRMLSFRDVGAAALLSRAAGGVADGCGLFVVPGSPAAAELALSELILPEAAHLVAQARRGAGVG